MAFDLRTKRAYIAAKFVAAEEAGVAVFNGNNALIGYTGFVGSNLLRQVAFSRVYNSGNIAEIRGREFELVVCAGVAAVKWRANAEPKADWAAIRALLEPLATVRTRRFVLISTVDVYPVPCGVDESCDPHGIENHPYGAHRLRVEDFVRANFDNHHVVRLPGLFGPGLKKNVIYDLLHANCLAAINPESVFQYYNLARLRADLEVVVRSELPLVNLAVEPLKTARIIAEFFPRSVVGAGVAAAGATRYDIQTRQASCWGRSGRYLCSGLEVRRDLALFIAAQRALLAGEQG